MSWNFLQQKTMRGFELGEVVSALQKSVRRNDEKQAVQWAAEMDQSGFGSYLWNRLTIITSEDVGVGWPEGPAVIAALRKSYEDMVSKGRRGGSERIFVIHAVMLLARAKKSRRVDVAIWSAYGNEKPEFPEIPDYALDWHTNRGRAMGRNGSSPEGLRHWLEEAARLENEDENATEADYMERFMSSDEDVFQRQGGTVARPSELSKKPAGLFDAEDV